MLWVFWVGDGVKELTIAGKAADVFRRAFTGNFGQPRIELTGHRGDKLADFDPVFPVVTKIVDVVGVIARFVR